MVCEINLVLDSKDIVMFNIFLNDMNVHEKIRFIIKCELYYQFCVML